MSERTDTIVEELLALRKGNGVINASEVVTWARANKKSQVHASLTWDDKVAGERYRIWQVRALISLHIRDTEGGRRFVSLSIDRPVGGYRELSSVMSSDELRAVMLEDALADLERVQKRYEKLQELAGVWGEAAKVAATVRPSRRKAAA
jgi:hypothetical protein